MAEPWLRERLAEIEASLERLARSCSRQGSEELLDKRLEAIEGHLAWISASQDTVASQVRTLARRSRDSWVPEAAAACSGADAGRGPEAPRPAADLGGASAGMVSEASSQPQDQRSTWISDAEGEHPRVSTVTFDEGVKEEGMADTASMIARSSTREGSIAVEPGLGFEEAQAIVTNLMGSRTLAAATSGSRPVGGGTVVGLNSSLRLLSERTEVGHALSDEVGMGVRLKSMPAGWPSSLEPRVYAFPDDSSVQAMMPSIDAFRKKTTWMLSRQTPLMDRERSTLEGIFCDPTSMFHVSLDLIGILVLFHDLTLIPYALAWQLKFEGYFQQAAIASATFWVLDTLVKFIRGFHVGLELVTSPRRIARRYIKSWFIPDLIVILCDWTNIIMEVSLDNDVSSVGGVKMLRFARVTRLVRIVVIMRFFKILQKLQMQMGSLLSESLSLSISFLGLVVGCLWTNHLVACFWVGLGSGSSDTGHRWIEAIADDDKSNQNYLYITSYHWALAQLSLGSMEVTCRSSGERIFNIFCLIVGLFGGSALVSLLSGLTVEFFVRRREASEKVRNLRRYLRQHSIPGKLAGQVLRQVNDRLHRRRPLDEEAVVALQLLSATLSDELHFCVCRPQLSLNPLLLCFVNLQQEWARTFCRRCLEPLSVMQSDELFRAGELASRAFVLVGGKMTYSQQPATSAVVHAAERRVGEGTTLAEAALWCHWLHVGAAEAKGMCSVLRISVAGFQECLALHPLVGLVAAEYCKAFYLRLSRSRPPYAPYPSDVLVPHASFGEVVHAMGCRNAARIIGLQAIRTHGLGKLQELVAEVDAGSSTVIVEQGSKLLRVVSLCALEVVHDDGRVFAEIGAIGSVVDGVRTYACQLPGTKLEQSETVSDALERLVASRLGPLLPLLCVTGSRIEDYERPSKKYNIPTRYIRHVCTASISDEGELSSFRAVAKGRAAPAMAPQTAMTGVSTEACTAAPSTSPCANLTSASAASTGRSTGWRRQRRALETMWPGHAGGEPEAPEPKVEDFWCRPVYLFDDGEQLRCYAWLEPSEVLALQQPSAAQVLQEWLAILGDLSPEGLQSSTV